MNKTIAVVAAVGFAIALWYAYFWLEEQRRWAQPVPLRREPAVDLTRYRGLL